jgi:acylphosphatase
LDVSLSFDNMAQGVRTTMGQKQVHLVVQGRVQGVYFRASTQQEAQRLGVRGWVKNRPDGSVEILAQASESTLKEFVAWAHRGPSAARVDHVAIKWDDATGHFDLFEVIR